MYIYFNEIPFRKAGEILPSENFQVPIRVIRFGKIEAKSILDTWEIGQVISNEIFFDDPVYSIKGLQYIIDYQDFGMAHASQIMKHPFKFSSNVHLAMMYPVKVKKFHLVNAPPSFSRLFKMSQALLSKKIRDRVILHSDLQSLHREISKDVLPDFLGGTAGDFMALNSILSINLKCLIYI